MDLKQKRFFSVREFTFRNNCLGVKYKDLTSSDELNIPYEEIDTIKIRKQKKNDNALLLITIFFGLVFIINILNLDNYKDKSFLGVAIFLFLATLVSGLITYLKFKNIILIPTANNGHLELYLTIPSKVETDNFITELTQRINTYLKTKYASIDKDMPIDQQMSNLLWLKEREVLSIKEFEDLKMKLRNNGNGEKSIGF
jgi:hypothetical protein